MIFSHVQRRLIAIASTSLGRYGGAHGGFSPTLCSNFGRGKADPCLENPFGKNLAKSDAFNIIQDRVVQCARNSKLHPRGQSRQPMSRPVRAPVLAIHQLSHRRVFTCSKDYPPQYPAVRCGPSSENFHSCYLSNCQLESRYNFQSNHRLRNWVNEYERKFTSHLGWPGRSPRFVFLSCFDEVRVDFLTRNDLFVSSRIKRSP